MRSVNWNKYWQEEYDWPEDGDEWDQQANYSNQPYLAWKKSIVKNFIFPNISKDKTVLEIAPGHGRWTVFLQKEVKMLHLVDLNEECIEFCKEKFKDHNNLSYWINNGRSLEFIEDKSIDFVWSYDSFVHMEKDVIEAYFSEFSRILRENGLILIHHPGRRHKTLKLYFLTKLGRPGIVLYQIISMGFKNIRKTGWRSNVSKELILSLAKRHNLRVDEQINTWGEQNQYNIKMFNDYISFIGIASK